MDEAAGCAEIRELLPELAAGVAEGEERARALRHLRECADCRRELAALATVADELLTLAPPVEPPRGFEAAVLARIAPARPVEVEAPGGSKRPWRRLRLVAAAVLVAAISARITPRAPMEAAARDPHPARPDPRKLPVAAGRDPTARP